MGNMCDSFIILIYGKLVAYLGFEARVGQESIFSPSSAVATVIGGAKWNFCASLGMLYMWFHS
jgi:hypothetical protein